MASNERLKQKCNKLIDMAKAKEKELQELQEVLYDLLDEKAMYEEKLKEREIPEADYTGGEIQLLQPLQLSLIEPENNNVYFDGSQFPIIRSSSALYAEKIPYTDMSQFGTQELLYKNNVKQISEQDLLKIFQNFGNKLNERLDDAIDKKIEEKSRHVNPDKKSQKEEDKSYLGITDGVAIIYEHSGFYDVIRKVGYVLFLAFILAIMAFAVISVSTLI